MPANFTFETTADGSPTVRIHGKNGELSESMHSLKGAFSETAYIYGAAIEKCLEQGFSPRVLSMGLGLGYVEILSAAMILKYAKTSDAGGESFEIVPELREWFSAWVKQSTSLPAEFQVTYDEILKRTSELSGQSEIKIRDYLAELISRDAWKLRTELKPETTFQQRFGVICFDAFSSKSTPDLWSEDFLKNFLKRACEPGCILSTYACTGQLKRALRASGFQVEIREGFASKRDSTFAVRPGSSLS